MAEDAVSLGRGRRRGAVPCGLGARDTLRLEVCYPLHGNDITPETDAISAGLGWVCALDKEFTGVEELRRIKEDGPDRRLVAFVMEERAVPRAGMPIAEGGEVTSGTHSPMLEQGIGIGYVPAEHSRAWDRDDDRRARPAAEGARRQETDLHARRVVVAAAENYPDELKYHPEHDWAQDRGRRGDPRGHLVRAGLARRARPLRAARGGRRGREGPPYGEVESVKAVSDLISPLSGRVRRGQPEGRRRARDGERGPLRRGLARPHRADRSRRGGRAPRRRGVPEAGRRAVTPTTPWATSL